MADYSNLIEKYKSKLKEDSSAKVFAPLGEIYRKIGMYDEAIKTLSLGLKLNPTYSLGQLALAQCFADLEEYQQAYNLLDPYVRNNSDNVKFVLLYAQMCIKLSLFEEALQSYKTVLFYSPRHEEAKEYIKLNEDEILEKKYDQELATFDVEELDENIESWNQVSLIEQNDVEVTNVEIKEKIVEEDPEPYFSHTLVDLYLKQGARDKALELLVKAVEINPADLPAIERLKKLREEEKITHGHDDLMKAFDSRVEQLNRDTEDKIENVKMAFDLFMVHINKKRDTVLTR